MTRLKLLLKITTTHLISRLRQSSIAALGVTFGIGTFIVLVSFMTGLNGLLDGLVMNSSPHIRIFNEIEPSKRQPIQNDVRYLKSFHLIESIRPKSKGTKIYNSAPLVAHLLKDHRVKGVAPRVEVKAFYLAGSTALNGLISGIDVHQGYSQPNASGSNTTRIIGVWIEMM